MVKKCHTSGKKNLYNVLQKETYFMAVTTYMPGLLSLLNHLSCRLHILLMTTGAYRVMY